MPGLEIVLYYPRRLLSWLWGSLQTYPFQWCGVCGLLLSIGIIAWGYTLGGW
ncbi:MAG TPA: hypothetical protein VLA77_02925 [Candidatus Saccharimonadales bacterium]|nr:hypothetical protein [Candidatus Saccharimonadales bacterium]